MKHIEDTGGGILTNMRYWDCACTRNYIHFKKKGRYCPKCKTHESDGMPDSRVNEIGLLYDPTKDCAIKS